ncbi:ferrous iron transport protein A [Candidatus Sumerlaeota bacterium]|nr:ferrous iron transport protein A [Candidatus Sumerlaeota bacterium]
MTDKEKPMLPLTLISPGREVILRAIAGGRQIRSRLTDMGFVPDLEFKVLQNFKPGPCVISIGNARIALGRGVSEKILVVEKE